MAKKTGLFALRSCLFPLKQTSIYLEIYEVFALRVELQSRVFHSESFAFSMKFKWYVKCLCLQVKLGLKSEEPYLRLNPSNTRVLAGCGVEGL